MKSARILRCILFACIIVAGCTTEIPTVDPDLTEAIQWYTGVSGQIDNARAKELLINAASDGDPISRMWIARVYSRGRMGFEENIDSAHAIGDHVIDDIENAAHQNVAEAMFLMGTAFAEGIGKERNDSVAVHWYRKAADLGNVLAQHNMGNVYFTGTGVPQNDSLAVHWWTMAASQGDAIPQLRLGTMYEEGRGVNVDLGEARRWFTNAANRGNQDAADALARLND